LFAALGDAKATEFWQQKRDVLIDQQRALNSKLVEDQRALFSAQEEEKSVLRVAQEEEKSALLSAQEEEQRALLIAQENKRRASFCTNLDDTVLPLYTLVCFTIGLRRSKVTHHQSC
jgi:hypothetical protein